MSEEEDDGFVEFELQPGDLNSESGSESDEEKFEGEPPKPATILLVSHLPFGFFEDEMKNFFKQFGTILNVKIARSSRSARSKGYGWVQFKSADVAAIACKTMNGYMMFKKKLVCKILTPEQVDAAKLFRNSRRKMLPSRRPALHKARVNAPIDEERHAKQVKRHAEKRKRLENELERLGIDYVLPGAEKKEKEEVKQAKMLKDVDVPKEAPKKAEKKKAKKVEVAVEEAKAAPQKSNKKTVEAKVNSTKKKPVKK